MRADHARCSDFQIAAVPLRAKLHPLIRQKCIGLSRGPVTSSGRLDRSHSPAHKTKSIRFNRKPLLDLSLMAAASYRYHPVGDLEPQTEQADTLWPVRDLNTSQIPARAAGPNSN